MTMISSSPIAEMMKAYRAMPLRLRQLTASTIAFPLIALGPLIPHSRLRVFGKLVTPALWWGSGAGAAMFTIALLFFVSAVKMLQRSQLGRTWYVFGWVMLTLLPLYLDRQFGSGEANYLLAVTVLGASTLLTARYLYASPDVRAYFNG